MLIPRLVPRLHGGSAEWSLRGPSSFSSHVALLSYTPGRKYPLTRKIVRFCKRIISHKIAVRDYAFAETHNLASERVLPAGSIGKKRDV